MVGSFIILRVLIFPVASMAAGLLGYYIFNNSYIMPLIVAIIAVAAILAGFSASFWFWAVLYTLLAFVSGLVGQVLSFK